MKRSDDFKYLTACDGLRTYEGMKEPLGFISHHI